MLYAGYVASVELHDTHSWEFKFKNARMQKMLNIKFQPQVRWAKSVPMEGNKKVVLMELAERSDETGKGEISITNLVHKSGLSYEVTVREIIIYLSERQIIHLLPSSCNSIIRFQLSMHIPPHYFKHLCV